MQPITQLGISSPHVGAAVQLPPGPTYSVGGLMSAKPLSTLLAEEATAEAVQRAAEAAENPVIQSLAGHIRKHWALARDAKEPIERDMLSAVRARRGEYDPDMLGRIRKQGGSDIYMMLFATKARQAKALLTDILIGTGTEKPWTIQPTPDPELPPEETEKIIGAAQEQAEQAEMSGVPVTVESLRQYMMDAKQATENQIQETARLYAERAERRIEDMLIEGRWINALDQFLDDLTVFKTAFLKGPVVRRQPRLQWAPLPTGGFAPQMATTETVTWERADPFNIYPAPWARDVHDGFLIERHRLNRSELSSMIGTEGYSEDAIRAALDEHGIGGLHDWLTLDTSKPVAEGRGADSQMSSELIDALQYWGSVSGKMLREWGMGDDEVTDDAKEYEVECWLVGRHVIKAVLNPDPLNRRPYYADGYSRLPGSFWHNSLYDVVRDCQDMCNSAARALANNLGISSGPQVALNVDRLPAGEALTEMFPWKIWQVTNDPLGSSARAVDFFQPQSNAQELMGVYERFSLIADEVSGIPKYLAGFSGGMGGAGRTASGMSMMIGNATKQIKQLVSSIDLYVIGPSIERAYHWMMQYDPRADVKGDLKIVARGAVSLITREAAQLRRGEFLMATGNPIDLQIMGLEGRAEILRESAKGLNLNVDKIIPSLTVIKQRAHAMSAQQQQAMAEQMPGTQAQQGGQRPPGGSGQVLMDDTGTTDFF